MCPHNTMRSVVSSSGSYRRQMKRQIDKFQCISFSYDGVMYLKIPIEIVQKHADCHDFL